MTFGSLTNQYIKKQEEQPLRNGDQGTRVEQLQRELTSLGYKLGPFDGSYGPKTTAAVRAFQEENNLETDGVYGPLTRTALSNALKA